MGVEATGDCRSKRTGCARLTGVARHACSRTIAERRRRPDKPDVLTWAGKILTACVARKFRLARHVCARDVAFVARALRSRRHAVRKTYRALTKRRMLRRNATVAVIQSDVRHVDAFESSQREVAGGCCSASACRRDDEASGSLSRWPRYCSTAGTRRPGCLSQRPRARRALVGTLPPARYSGEGERVWTVYDVGGHHGPPRRIKARRRPNRRR